LGDQIVAAVTRVELDAVDEAIREFRAAHAEDPSFKPDATIWSPKLAALFARATAQSAPAPASRDPIYRGAEALGFSFVLLWDEAPKDGKPLILVRLSSREEIRFALGTSPRRVANAMVVGMGQLPRREHLLQVAAGVVAPVVSYGMVLIGGAVSLLWPVARRFSIRVSAGALGSSFNAAAFDVHTTTTLSARDVTVALSGSSLYVPIGIGPSVRLFGNRRVDVTADVDLSGALFYLSHAGVVVAGTAGPGGQFLAFNLGGRAGFAAAVYVSTNLALTATAGFVAQAVLGGSETIATGRLPKTTVELAPFYAADVALGLSYRL
jgi:hypothetical protein